MKLPKLLFLQHYSIERAYSLKQHSHPFWQLELVLEGSFKLREANDSRDLKVGDVLLVPPGKPHGFEYSAQKTTWISCKFDLQDRKLNEVLSIQPDDCGKLILKAIQLLAEEPLTENSKMRLNHLLGAFIAPLFEPYWQYAEKSPSKSLLCFRIDELVDKSKSSPPCVNQIAAHLSFDAAYLSTKFKKETGMSLKTYLDKKRVHKAKELLKYSLYNISEIADLLQFPEVYSFSRFFKRCTGKSPKAFRYSHYQT